MKIKQHRVIEEIGWLGAFAVVLGYALTSLRVIEVDNIWYHLLNLVGAIGIIIMATAHRTKQTELVAAVRGVIALVSLASIYIASL